MRSWQIIWLTCLGLTRSEETGADSLSLTAVMIRSLLFKSAMSAAGYFQSDPDDYDSLVIKNAQAPMFWSGRYYFWADEFYAEQDNGDAARAKCSIAIVTLNGTLDNISFMDGNRPTEVVWSCRDKREFCCGFDCCDIWWWDQLSFSAQILLCALAALLCFGLIAFCVKECYCRRRKLPPKISRPDAMISIAGSMETLHEHDTATVARRQSLQDDTQMSVITHQHS